MKAKVRQITQSKFVRNVAIVATGTAGAQAITMAFAPFITRLYGPEAFGLLGVFMALVLMTAPIAALTYPIAIVLPKEDSDAKGLAWLSFYIALGMSSFIAIILFFWGDGFLTLIGSQSILPYVMLLPLSMFFAAMLQIAEQWLIRKKHFKITAKVAVYKSFIVGSLQTGVGLIKPIGAVLIIVATLGSILQAVMLFIGTKNANTKEKVSLNVTERGRQIGANKDYKQLASTHRDFPLYRSPQVFINAISLSLPVLMLASFFGPAAAGFYTIAMSVLGVPSILLGKSVGDVFYQRITEATHHGENLTRLLLKATGMLALIGFVPFAIVMVFGPWLFGFVFGDEWHIAGEYAQWLALWLFISLTARPTIAALPALKLQGLFLIYEIVGASMRLSALVIGFKLYDDAIVAIAIFSISGAFLNLTIILISLYKSRLFKREETKYD